MCRGWGGRGGRCKKFIWEAISGNTWKEWRREQKETGKEHRLLLWATGTQSHWGPSRRPWSTRQSGSIKVLEAGVLTLSLVEWLLSRGNIDAANGKYFEHHSSYPLQPHPPHIPSTVCSRDWLDKRDWRATLLGDLPVPETRSLPPPVPDLLLQWLPLTQQNKVQTPSPT